MIPVAVVVSCPKLLTSGQCCEADIRCVVEEIHLDGKFHLIVDTPAACPTCGTSPALRDLAVYEYERGRDWP